MDVFPARAGMNRYRQRAECRDPRVPRPRGDEPVDARYRPEIVTCSPPAWGDERRCPTRERRDRQLGEAIRRVWEENFRVYGVRRPGGFDVDAARPPGPVRGTGRTRRPARLAGRPYA